MPAAPVSKRFERWNWLGIKNSSLVEGGIFDDENFISCLYPFHYTWSGNCHRFDAVAVMDCTCGPLISPFEGNNRIICKNVTSCIQNRVVNSCGPLFPFATWVMTSWQISWQMHSSSQDSSSDNEYFCLGALSIVTEDFSVQIDFLSAASSVASPLW